MLYYITCRVQQRPGSYYRVPRPRVTAVQSMSEKSWSVEPVNPAARHTPKVCPLVANQEPGTLNFIYTPYTAAVSHRQTQQSRIIHIYTYHMIYMIFPLFMKLGSHARYLSVHTSKRRRIRREPEYNNYNYDDEEWVKTKIKKWVTAFVLPYASYCCMYVNLSAVWYFHFLLQKNESLQDSGSRPEEIGSVSTNFRESSSLVNIFQITQKITKRKKGHSSWDTCCSACLARQTPLGVIDNYFLFSTAV